MGLKASTANIGNFANAWLNRLRWMGSAFAGKQFGGKRDLYATFGYAVAPTFMDFLNLYLRQEIAQRIINEPVKGTWTEPPKVTGNSAFEKVWEKLYQNTNLFYHLGRADTFCGLGQLSVLVIGFDDGKALEKPVTPKQGRQIIYLQPYMEGSITVTEFDTDQTSPRFGLPVMYEISPGEVLSARQDPTIQFKLRNNFKVHFSRILHLADNCLENTVFGHSRLESLINVLWDLQKVCGGASETFWLTANRGLHVDVDKEMDLDPDSADALSAELDEYQQQLRRFIRTRGVKVTSLGTDVADPTGIFNMLLSLVAANTGIPKRILMGAEAGQLASQQDRANWSVQIAQRVINFAEPVVLKPFIQLCQYAGVLPEAAWDTLEVKWPDTYKMSPFEKSQTSAQLARSMANVTTALATSRQQIGETVFTVAEAREAVAFGDFLPIFDGLPKTQLSKIGEGPLDNPAITNPAPVAADGNKNNDPFGKGSGNKDGTGAGAA